MLRLVQINLHHSKAASANLNSFLIEKRIHLALIQEPWISSNNEICGLDMVGYNLFYLKSDVSTRRACILACKSLKSFLIPSLCSGDTTSIKIERSEGDLVIVASYMAHDKPSPPDDICNIYNVCSEQGLDLIIGCDANSHHTQWGSTDINERGESLLDYIISTNLEICNIGDYPTFITRNRAEVLDVTLSSLKNSSVQKWRVSKTPSLSDHCLITFEVNQSEKGEKPFRILNKTDWTKFADLIDRKLAAPSSNMFTSPDDINKNVELITKILYESHTECCPLVKPSKKKHPTWWNKEISELRSESRKQFNKAKKSGDTLEWNLYKFKLRHFKATIKVAKRDSWEKFCANIGSVKETARLRKLLSKTDTAPSYIMDDEGQWTSSSKETLESLFNTHFPGCKDLDLVENSLTVNQQTSYLHSDLENIFTEEKVQWAISSFSPYKSPGPDGIFPAILQNSGSNLVSWLCLVFKSCLRLEYIPTLWRKTRVVFIPKAGKSSHCKPKDFRPISLSSFSLKTMERVLELSINQTIPRDSLSSSQHAYTKGKSVETAIHEVVHRVEKTLVAGQYTLAAFLDIEGAFNNISTEVIVSSLSKLGISQNIVRLIKNMLMSRIIQSESGSSKLEKTVCRGTPQGGVLSPLLWNISLNSILVKLKNLGAEVVAYADDLVIMVSGFDLTTIRDIMQSALELLSKWASECGLGVNPSKTEMVLFTKNKMTDFRDIILNGTTINLSKTATFLGIVLDSKLTWQDNTANRIKKATNALYICKKSFSKTWGLKPKLILWIYTAIVRPILTYGCIAWWNCLSKTTYLGKLEKVQRLACICVTGALKSTATKSLETILNLTSLDLFCQGVAAKAALRLNSAGMWRSRSYGHGKILSNFNLSNPSTDHIISTPNLFKSYNMLIPKREEWSTGCPIPDSEVIYTDGSKMENGVGSGFFYEKGNLKQSFKLHKDCSIFQAEVYAIYKAALYINSSDFKGKTFVLCVDSQAAIKALFSRYFNSKTVFECAKLLDKISRDCNLTLCWVPGHSNVAGNDTVDVLAKNGCLLPMGNTDNEISCPIQFHKTMVDQEIIKRHNRNWRKLKDKCIISRSLWPSLNKNKTLSLVSQNKSDIRLLTHILTGHCLFGKHLSKISKTSLETCRSCDAIDSFESIDHLLCECPELRHKRLKTLGQFYFNDLDELQDVDLNQILKFVKSVGWHTTNYLT